MRFDDDIFDFANFGKGQAPAEPDAAMASDEGADAADRAEAKRAHRRTKECTELSQRYEYRRAFSEVRMLEAMKYVPLQDGHTYNFITAGDVDSLSFLKVVLNQHDLDFMLCSTWCMAAEDILQIQQCTWVRYSPAVTKSSGRWSKNSMPPTRTLAVPPSSRTTAKFTPGVTWPMGFTLAYRQART